MNEKDSIDSRPLRAEDFAPILHFLQQTLPLMPAGFNWDIRRWEGMRSYDPRTGGNPDWPANGRVWRTGRGQIAGVVHGDGPGWPALQVHPDYRHLEGELIDWAEERLAAPAKNGNGRVVHLFVYTYDVYRQRLLRDRGYEETGRGGASRHMRLGAAPALRPEIAAGYLLRATDPQEPADAERIAVLLNAAFGRDFHNAAEYRQFTRQASCFRPALDLVAVAPDGSFAAYVGVPYDETNRRGIFEPVCTHPEHRQKGLAGTLMREGLVRLQALGAVDVVVETGDMIPANRLYDSLGFTEMYTGRIWRKELLP